MIIAIDGLSTNGKSTLARMISEKLNFKNFNTGSIYRCITLFIIEKNLNIKNTEKLIQELENINIDFKNNRVILNNIDVTDKIRTEEISYFSTKLGTIPEIKDFVRKYQKNFIKNNNTVIEGRDICTRIAPDAEYKFYLYSDFNTRAERLWKTKQSIPFEQIKEDLRKIDKIDIEEGNFIKPNNAIEIDTTKLTIEEVFKIMMDKIKIKNNSITIDLYYDSK